MLQENYVEDLTHVTIYLKKLFYCTVMFNFVKVVSQKSETPDFPTTYTVMWNK